MSPQVVAVALSGGVDSLISGYLIKKKYKEVFGIHFTSGSEQEPVDIKSIESQLGFPVYTLDLTREFNKEVVDYFVSSYMAGTTPNPCVMCNKKIKFGALMDHALKLGADAMATGHYATIVNPISFPEKEVEYSYLEKGADPKKDQSYFLAMLNSGQLDRLIFPLAATHKEEVQSIARENRLRPSVPSESQDICFIHEKSVSDYMANKKGIRPCPGNIINAEGKVVGTHQGLHTFTIGQRRGINVPASQPYYVRHIDMATNTLEVCFKEDLAQSQFSVDQINWNYSAHTEIQNITTKIRYSHKGALSRLEMDNTRGRVFFHTPQNAITPGQAAVFYMENRVLGAGIIQ